MSHLSDLLSKIKQSDLKKEIPPGLSDTITSLKKKESGKRRILFFSILLGASLSLGLATAYFVDYLKIKPLRVSEPIHNLQNLENLQNVQPLATSQVNKMDAPADATDKGNSQKEIPENPQPELVEKEAGLNQVESNPSRNDPEAKLLQNGVHDHDTNREINEQVSGLFYLARNHEMSGELLKALETYKKVLQIDPDNYKTMNNISALMIRLNMWDESLGYLLETIKLDNQYVPALINLGIVYAKTEKFSESEKMLLKALSLEENNRLALVNIAILYEKKGFHESARIYYQRLKDLGDIEGVNGLKRLGKYN